MRSYAEKCGNSLRFSAYSPRLGGEIFSSLGDSKTLQYFSKARQILIETSDRRRAGDDADFFVHQNKGLKLLEIQAVRGEPLDDFDGGLAA